jgi:predicted GNAT family N-acyltransferase
MNIDTEKFILTDNLLSHHKKQLFMLYQKMWWADNRTQKEMNDIIKNSSFVVGIIDVTKDAVVGFARILTDYYTLAYIFDVIICESCRGKSLGKFLMNYIVEHEKLKNVAKIELACRQEMIPFYQQFDFLEDYDDTIVMRRRNTKITILSDS